MTARREPSVSARAPQPNKDREKWKRIALALSAARREREMNCAKFSLNEATDLLIAEHTKEFPRAKRHPLVNGRNLHFDAIAEAFGYNGSMTASESGCIAKALKEVREVEPDVTPEKLGKVARAALAKYGNGGTLKPRPTIVASHWSEFAGARELAGNAAHAGEAQGVGRGRRPAKQVARSVPDHP
jgi:hypothetical protein